MAETEAAFAARHGLWLDTHVTLSWRLLGAERDADVQRLFTKFLKCLRAWLDERRLPVAYLYAHEYGRKVGLHTHVMLYVPGFWESRPACWGNRVTARQELKRWAGRWPERQLGRAAPRALRVISRAVETPWLHWLMFHYLVKGFDRDVVVQSGERSPDGRPVMLGDLIAFDWADPGPVTMTKRVGASRSLGPEHQEFGAPGCLREHYWTWERGLSPDAQAALIAMLDRRPSSSTSSDLPPLGRSSPRYRAVPFRSAFDDGCRDIRWLYPQWFHERITRLFPAPAAPDNPPADGQVLVVDEWMLEQERRLVLGNSLF